MVYLPKKKMQEKTNGNVPTVEIEKPKKETEKAIPENRQTPETAEASMTEVARKQPPDGLVSEATQPIFEIDHQMKSLAKRFGIPLDKIIKYTQMQDARITQLETAISTLGVKLQPVIELGARIKQAQNNPQAPSGGIGGGGQPAQFMDFAMRALGGGGGGGSMWDEEMQGLMKDLVRSSIASAKEERGLSRSIAQAVVNNIAGKAAKNVIDASGS